MSTRVTCAYTVNAAGRTPAEVQTSMQTPAVDPATLEVTGVTVASDVTTVVGSAVTRTIVLNFTPTFNRRFLPTSDQRDPFWSFMTNILQAAVGSPVLAAAPVLS